MKTTMKKNLKVFAALVVVVFGVMAISRSLAYFTSEKDHDSQYQFSMIDTSITEEFEKESENVYVKNPRIVNKGESDAVVRVYVEVSNSTQKDNIKFLDKEGNPINPDREDWIYNEDDGYFYYQHILPTGATTSTLFDKVEIIHVDKMEDFDIIVYSEAIQTVIYDENGQVVATALDSDGNYNHTNAMKLWKEYK